jgi:drug/metabolite transporter (DMT)-like permease
MPSPPTATDARFGAGPVAAYLVVCIVWGSTYVAIRLAVESMPPLVMVGTRSVIAGLAMTGFALARGATLPRGAALGRLAVAALLLFVGGQTMLAIGEQRIESGQAAVIGAMQALVMPLAAWAIGAAGPPRRSAWLGLLLGFAGVVLLVNPGAATLNLAGMGCVLTSVVSWSIGGAMARRWPMANVILGSGLQMLIGGAACLALSFPLGAWHGFSLEAVTARSWEGFFYLITMGSLVGFSSFAWLVQIWPPARVATYTYVNPIVALLLGSLVAGEVLTLRELLATGVILSAVAVVMAGSRVGRR